MHMCVKLDVCKTNISGVIHKNVTETEQIWLLNKEFLE